MLLKDKWHARGCTFVTKTHAKRLFRWARERRKQERERERENEKKKKERKRERKEG